MPSEGSLKTAMSRETPIFTEKDASHHLEGHDSKDGEDYDSIKYPEPSKYEKFLVGSYSQNQMLKI